MRAFRQGRDQKRLGAGHGPGPMRRAFPLAALLVAGLLAPLAAGEAACEAREGPRVASAGTVAVGSSTVTCEEGQARWSARRFGASESTTGARADASDDGFEHATDHFDCRAQARRAAVDAGVARAAAGVEDAECVMTFQDARSGQRSRGAFVAADALGHREAARAALVGQGWEGDAAERRDTRVLVLLLVREEGRCYEWWAPGQDVPVALCDAADAAAGAVLDAPLPALHP